MRYILLRLHIHKPISKSTLLTEGTLSTETMKFLSIVIRNNKYILVAENRITFVKKYIFDRYTMMFMNLKVVEIEWYFYLVYDHRATHPPDAHPPVTQPLRRGIVPNLGVYLRT